MSTLINAVQISLTAVFIVACCLLLNIWGPLVLSAFRAVGWRFWRAWQKWDADEWLGVGIVIGFGGNILDNIYWGITWLTVQYDLPQEDFFMGNGPLANIFFRQIIGIIAVYCHIHAAKMIHDAGMEFPTRRLLMFGLGLTILLLIPFETS